MPGTRTTTQLNGGGVAVQLDQLLAAVGMTDWVYLTSRVQVQLSGVATSVTVQVERSTADPAGTANPAPVAAAATGNPSTGMTVLTFDEAAAAWWRVRVTAITGASVAISIGGRGAATPALIAQDRTAPPRLSRLRLSTYVATAGTTFTADVLDQAAGTELRLSRNPGGRYTLAGTTLTGKGLKYGIDTPSVIQLPGTSGALAPRETEFDIRVAHDPSVPAFTRPWGSIGAAPYPIFPLGTKIAQLGDSLDAHGVSGVRASVGVPPTAVKKLITGEMEQAQSLKPRFAFENWPSDTNTRDLAAGLGGPYIQQDTRGANGAVSGSPATFHQTLLADCLAMGAPIFKYSATVNSVTVPGAENYIIDNILSPAMSAGRYLVVGTLRPWASTASFDSQVNRDARIRVNTALRAFVTAQGPAKALLIDWDAVYDPGNTGLASAALFYDKLHLNAYGCSLGAVYLNSRLDLILPSSGNIFLDRAGTLANKLINPSFTGTGGARGGTVQAGSVIPTGWRAQSGGSTASTCVVTVEANPVTGGQSVVFTITPNAGSIANESFQFLPSAASGIVTDTGVASKYLAAFFQFDVGAHPSVGIPSVFMVDAGVSTIYARGLDYDTGYPGIPGHGVAHNRHVSTDPIQMDAANTTGFKPQAILRLDGAAAWAATGAQAIVVKINFGWSGEVGDPKPRWNS